MGTKPITQNFMIDIFIVLISLIISTLLKLLLLRTMVRIERIGLGIINLINRLSIPFLLGN